MRNLVLAFLILLAFATTTFGFEIDSEGYVTRVVDGDTIDIFASSGFGVGTEYRIRLADINAPELSTLEGQMAKLALQNLLDSKHVYVDVDDITTYDNYGRVVAVVYLPINSTHVLNVNYYMVENGYAEIWDFTNNEFNPYTWKLYEPIGVNVTKKVVNLDTGEEFTSIQAAIDDLDTKNGHTIAIYPGDYEENVVINKSVTIMSYTGDSLDTRIIAFNKSLPAISVLADNVTISNLTVSNDDCYGCTAISVVGNNTRILNNLIEGYKAVDVSGSGCLISMNTVVGRGGVFIRADHVNVSYNLMDVSSDAVYCSGASSIFIIGNNISATHFAVVLRESDGVYFARNVVSGSTAVDISKSTDITVVSNLISASFAGIEIMSSDKNKISSNVIYSGKGATGIRLFYSSSNTINDNILYGGGIFVEYGDGYGYKAQNNFVFNNTVNGRPLIYLENEKGVSVVNAGQVIAINCSSISVKNSNLSNVYVGVEFIDTSYSTIKDCTISSNRYGIYLTGAGEGSKNNLISHNNISDCEVGVLINNFRHLYKNNNTILGNSIINCDTGIKLLYTHQNSVLGNKVRGSCYGLYLHAASSNLISNNTIDGLMVEDSTSNLLYNNIFNLKCFSTHCSFKECPNYWNTTKTLGRNILGGRYMGGNVWVKPDGTGFSQVCEDNDSDGICDQVYRISSSNIDYLPLKYSLLPVASFTFIPTYPMVGEVVTFDASSSHDPDGQIVSYEWDFGDGSTQTTASPTIQHTYSQAGTYIVTLTITDNSGLMASTSETITIHSEPWQRYDSDGDKKISTSELSEAINDWLNDRLDTDGLMKVIAKWLES